MPGSLEMGSLRGRQMCIGIIILWECGARVASFNDGQEVLVYDVGVEFVVQFVFLVISKVLEELPRKASYDRSILVIQFSVRCCAVEVGYQLIDFLCQG